MTDIKRRHFLVGATALSGASVFPKKSWAAQSPQSIAQDFKRASEKHEWTIGWQNPSSNTLNTPVVKCVLGKIPEGLNGRFYRNGPAIRDRAGERMQHWFDGDGMVQSFHLTEAGVSHQGRLVQTAKFLRDEAAGRFTAGGFGSLVKDSLPLTGLDSSNVANTSIVKIGNEMMALWEGGSAHRMDVETLDTLGVKVWNEHLGAMPFSAHPKVETDGTIWNFGQNAFDESLIIYKIARSGSLQNLAVLEDVPAGMMHDFCMTKRHLVFVVPSLRMTTQGQTYLDYFSWQPNVGQRVIVLDKDDLTNRRDFELPPGLQYHFGNAFEEPSGDIRFSICMIDPLSITTGLKDIMRGKITHKTQGRLTHVCLRASGQAEITERVEHFGDHEFPQFNPAFVEQRARYLYTVGVSRKRRPSESAILRHDIDNGDIKHFDYGPTAIAEEHLFVQKPHATAETDGWLIGTVLDFSKKTTSLNILDAQHIEDGPVAIYELPYALPLGFHGTWVSS